MSALQDYGAPIGAVILLFLLPALFVAGAVLIDWRSRRRGEPAFRRLFAVAGYSGWVLVALVALPIVSMILPHHASANSSLLTASYALGLSWIYLFLLTGIAVIVCTVCGLIVKHVTERRT